MNRWRDYPLPNGRGPTRGSERGEGPPLNQRQATVPLRPIRHRRALTPDASHPTPDQVRGRLLSHPGEGA
jgi:hypothetical protein